MKKLLALVMALAMLLSFAMAEVASVNFLEMLPEDQLALGTYDTINEDMPAKMWVLNDTFIVADLSEIPEDYATGMEIGMLKFAADENLKVIFSALRIDGEGTLAETVAAMQEDPETFSDVEEATVNGINSVSYTCKGVNGETLKYITYEVTDYVWLNIMFIDSDNLDYNQAVALTAASIAPAE